MGYDSVMFFVPLPAGTYIAVVTTYDEFEFGTYELSYTSFPTPKLVPVPSVNEWGLIILSLFLAGSVFWVMRRRRRES
jgi:hypothetical protein